MNKLQMLNPFISRYVAKQPNYPEKWYIFSPELVVSITEYAQNKPVHVYAATDMSWEHSASADEQKLPQKGNFPRLPYRSSW